MPKKSTVGFLILCIVLLSGSFYPMDAYITKPGGAYPLEPLVNVQGGDTDDVGTMNLMTIALAKATPITYSWAKIAENQKILQSNQVRRPNEDDEEYSIRQLKLMSQSQFNAILVAFQKADLPYEIISKGVFGCLRKIYVFIILFSSNLRKSGLYFNKNHVGRFKDS